MPLGDEGTIFFIVELWLGIQYPSWVWEKQLKGQKLGPIHVIVGKFKSWQN